MTTTIRDINELQDRRIMMEKKLPPFGYALILLTAALILFLVVWSTKNYRTYVSQSSGSVQAANKTYIMSSSSGSYYKMTITPDSTYVISNSGDKVDLSNGMSVTARVEYDKLTYFEYAMEALGVLFR